MTTTLAVVAATWGIAMAVSPVLQIRAILTHRSSKGVSVGYQAVLLLGFLLWLAYGLSAHNAALIVPNTVAALVSAVTIAVARRFREPLPGAQSG